MATVRCLYASKKYSQCEKICSKISHSPEADLLRGKALYHMYQKNQQQLRKHQGAMEPRAFFTQHKACYNMAKEVVHIFRRARNSSYKGMDACCDQMLDFAIMDYIFESNKLKDIELCFLCLKRPGPSTEVETPNSQVQDWVKEKLKEKHVCESDQDEPTKGKAIKPKQTPKENIRFSHLIPQSVIKYFMKSADVAPSSKNVLFGGPGTKLSSTRKCTAGKAAVYMLCPSCEHNLNVLGEQAFMGFLEKVYDPLVSNTETQHGYGKEMYHFCMGLIFRTLCPSQSEYINVDEVHQLLVQCRAFLTADCPLQACSNLPEVFMFVCPGEDDNYEERFCAFINQDSASYIGLMSLDCHVEMLHTFVSVLANFFMVKLGTIVLVVKFTPAAREPIDKRFQIDPEAGSYSIPASKARRELIPPGVWTALHLLYTSSERDHNNHNN